MRLTYDQEVDILMVHLGDPARFQRSQRLEVGGAVLDLDADGNILSIEVMGAARRYGAAAVAGLAAEQDGTT